MAEVWSGGLDLQGPFFLQEPPHRVEFSNSSGGRVDCSAHGSPPPEVEWVLSDGSTVRQISDLRLLLPNGSLYFPPFSSERYRHDIHSTVYKCRLQSSLGVVLSRDVHVKAVYDEAMVEVRFYVRPYGCNPAMFLFLALVGLSRT
ncbi:hypothetical protein QE152_g27126 [Popillia japonica]|uniref:Ig-like domain-containing protein n=1 Tax=Popillia japonica TaxID=7064 RepID=A0AAW1JWM7_POPJA